MCTDPVLCRPLTDPRCSYMSCLTSKAALEVKVEQSPTLKAEQSPTLKVEQSGAEFKLQRQSGMEF